MVEELQKTRLMEKAMGDDAQGIDLEDDDADEELDEDEKELDLEEKEEGGLEE